MSKYLMNICSKCNTAIATNGLLCNICIEEEYTEFQLCKSNPYYYATKYLTINDKPFTTLLKEKEFNEAVKKLGQIKKYV